MANEGFIKLYRKMLEWGWYDDGPTKDVFIHLLLIASYEDKFYRGITLERGQVVATASEISKQTGLSRQKIRWTAATTSSACTTCLHAARLIKQTSKAPSWIF